MEIRIRFYRERYNTDPDYYSGNEDIYKRIKFNDLNDLKRCWGALMHKYEGETYSLWIGKELVCGGAFDPGDLQYIEPAYNDILRRTANDEV